MTAVALEIWFIFLLAVANGIFAMSEMAIISARKTRLKQLADDDNAGARAALELARAPGRFLSTVQIGITLVGILAGVLGGATLSEKLAAGLSRIPYVEPYSEAISVGVVVMGITYLSLVIGELLPKRLALGRAERIACVVASPMQTLSRLTAPVVHLLNFSTEALLRVLRVRPAFESPVSEEEIKILIGQATRRGVFAPMEEEMVERVFRLGDRRVSALITPRPEIIWLDVDDSLEEIQRKVAASGHAHYPVARGDLDRVVGLVQAKDLLAQNLCDQTLDLEMVLQPALFVPESIPALAVLERFRETRSQIALVIDEYGGLQGLVTVNDFLQALVGDLPERGEPDEPEAFQRQDGSWLLDGMFQMDEFKELFRLKALPDKGEEGYYQTLGGFVMVRLGQIPSTGDYFDWEGLRFEVVDMDGLRVDKVLIVPAPVPRQDADADVKENGRQT
jgi:putative hemolysin